MKKLTLTLIITLCATLCIANGRQTVYSPTINTLQVVVNKDWLSPPVMELNSGDILHVSFDEMSHDYHRFVYKIEHCEADWSVSDGLFESDYMEGFNNNPIEDYQNSINTTILYTHYKLSIPNEKCRLKMSGNYRLTVYDEDNGNQKVLTAEFMVVEPLMTLGLAVTSNTDIDLNDSHQQLSMTVGYGPINITNREEQLYTIVTQNNSPESAKVNVKPNIVNNKGLQWNHNRGLIFDAGNEYRKYEILALSHPTMGIDHIDWDGHYYNVYPFMAEPRKNYLYDEDANGAFYIRNSDNTENDYTCDYAYVHYKLKSPELTDMTLAVNGWWTTNNDVNSYTMTYNPADATYNVTILQKQGYYSYRFMAIDAQGNTCIPPTEGNFYQTENRYQAYIYYKGTGERTWRLVGYRQVEFKSENASTISIGP